MLEAAGRQDAGALVFVRRDLKQLVGEADANAGRQTVVFDTMRWDDASSAFWSAARPLAAGCILSAASESGW